jgi:hypothetical protein
VKGDKHLVCFASTPLQEKNEKRKPSEWSLTFGMVGKKQSPFKRFTTILKVEVRTLCRKKLGLERWDNVTTKIIFKSILSICSKKKGTD